MKNLFEVASRKKFRFEHKGVLGVEQLWDCSVEDLNTIYKGLNKRAKQAQEESLLEVKTSEDVELEEKIEIIKYIVSVKLEERKARENEAAQRYKNDRIREIIARKKDEKLEELSVEELEAMLPNN